MQPPEIKMTDNDPRGYDEQTLRWLAARKEEAVRIDPATAKVSWIYGHISDPYGVLGPVEENNIGRVYFARSPEPDSILVCFYDLPAGTRDPLWTRIRAGDHAVWDPQDEMFFATGEVSENPTSCDFE
jgi:hypothetical protein